MLDSNAAQAILQAAIDAAGFDHKPVTTSREWKLPGKHSSAPSEWEKVTDLPGSIEDAVEVARELGLKPVSIARSALDPMDGVEEVCEVTLPKSWLENDDEGFKVFLQWLTHGPRGRPHRQTRES